MRIRFAWRTMQSGGGKGFSQLWEKSLRRNNAKNAGKLGLSRLSALFSTHYTIALHMALVKPRVS